jgi:hypothetical protein
MGVMQNDEGPCVSNRAVTANNYSAGNTNTTELPQHNCHFDQESNLVPQNEIQIGEAKTSQICRIIKVNTFLPHYSLLWYFFRLGQMIHGHPTRLPASVFEAGRKKNSAPKIGLISSLLED